MYKTAHGRDQATALRELVLQQGRTPSAVSRRPFIITVTSGKGGVGKSTVALNLALKLNDAARKTLLVDADTNLGTLDIMLGISPMFRLADVVRGDQDVDDVIVSVAPFLKLLAGNSGDPGCPAMTKERQQRLLETLMTTEERFEYVIIDTSAGISEHVLSYAAYADLIMVVTHPEPVAVLDAYAMIKMIHLTSPATQLKLLMNASRQPAQADEAATKLKLAVSHFLKFNVAYLGCIPFDRSVSEAAMEQVPVVRHSPSSGAALSFHLLAQHIDSLVEHHSHLRSVAL